MSNFIDLNDLKNLLPQPDVTQAPPPETVMPTPPVTLPPPPQTIPPTPNETCPPGYMRDPLVFRSDGGPVPCVPINTPSPTAAPPQIIVNVPESKDKDDYPRSPYWGGSRYYLPQYPQYLGSEVDNSIKTGNITTSWGSNNNNTSTEMNTPMPTPMATPAPILTLTPAPRAVQQEEGMSMTTKIVLGVCVAILIGGASYMVWRYLKNKKKSKGSNNNNSTTRRNNANNNTNNNFMNNLGSNNTNNTNNLPRPPSS